MQRFDTLTASLALTAGLALFSNAHGQSGPQKVPSGPTEKGFGMKLEQAESRLDGAIGVLEHLILRDDTRAYDPGVLLGLVRGAHDWVRAARTDLGSDGAQKVRRELDRAGTNLLNRSADSPLTIEDLGDFEAAILDARVERGLRRLARSSSGGAWTTSEYREVVDAWSKRVDFEVERQRARRASGVDEPEIIIDHGGPKYTLEQQRGRRSAGADQPDVIIDYGGPGYGVEQKRGRFATGVGQHELVIELQEGLDRTLQQTRRRQAAGLEETFLLVTEFRMKVARQRYRQQAEAGQDPTWTKILLFDLALQRQRQAARTGRAE